MACAGVAISSSLWAVSGWLGCASKPEARRPESFGTIQAVYRFRNVRSTSQGDEWAQIQHALSAGLSGETRSAISAGGGGGASVWRVVGGITLQDYGLRSACRHVEALAVWPGWMDWRTSHRRRLKADGLCQDGEQLTATYSADVVLSGWGQVIVEDRRCRLDSDALRRW